MIYTQKSSCIRSQNYEHANMIELKGHHKWIYNIKRGINVLHSVIKTECGNYPSIYILIHKIVFA